MLLDERYGQPFPAGLTRMPDKAALYALDAHFWEGWEDLSAIAGEAAQGMACNHALILVRPDAIASRKAHLVLDWLPTQGFRLVDCVLLPVSRHQVRSLWQYQWNVALRERRDACDALMSACPSLLLVIANAAPGKAPATQRFSERKGAADPALRRPGDLRAVLGHKSRMLSLLHSPDEAADFVREIAIFLPERARKALFAHMLKGRAFSGDDARAAVSTLYGQVPEHALEFDVALARVLAAAHRAADGAASSDLRAVETVAERIRTGVRTDWRDLFVPLDRLHAQYAPWDRVVIAGHMAAMDADGKQVLLDHPPAWPPQPSPVAGTFTGDVAC